VVYATRKDAIADGWVPVRTSTPLVRSAAAMVLVDRRWQVGTVVDINEISVVVDVDGRLIPVGRRDVLHQLQPCGRCDMLIDPDIDTDAVALDGVAFCELCAFLEDPQHA